MASSDPSTHDPATPSEMEIVDTFTKLIFGVADEFSEMEMAVVQVLREVDDNVAFDSLPDMGMYLRALGVDEMISLVSKVRRGYPPAGQTLFPALPGQRARFSP